MKNRKGFSLVVAFVAVLAVLLLANYLAGIKPSLEQAGDNSIRKFASYAELEDFVKKNSRGYSGYYGPPSFRTVTDAVSPQTLGVGAKSEASDLGQATTYSRTNVQVEGVDEADIVKTDGRYIYAVSANSRKVAILEAYPAENARMVSGINVSGNVNEIFVNKDRLVVFWQENVRLPLARAEPLEGNSKKVADVEIMPAFRYSPLTRVDVYDITDRKAPVLAKNISMDGNYFNSRMIGDNVYVIATNPAYYVKGEPIPLPAVRASGAEQKFVFPEVYYFDVPDRYYVFTTVAALNVMDNSAEPSSKILLTGATHNMYVSLGSIYLTYSKYTNIFESDAFIDKVIVPVLPLDWRNKVTGIQANSTLSRPEKLEEIMKTVEDFVKTLSPEQAQGLEVQAKTRMAELQREFSKEREKTVVQKLSIGDGKVEYKASGEVPGTILNQFSMDEHNGHFRIATTMTTEMGGITPMMVSVVEDRGTTGVVAVKSGSSGITAEEQKRLEETTKQEPIMVRPDIVPPQPSGPRNNVYVLDGDLKTVGKLEDLAPGERIYSVRFMGERAYMVTFRQMDPLFVIDLSRPAEPKVLGFLKIPGVSDYLHPYDESHIIGVGRDASEEGRILGMKLSLFDVTNVSAPKEISKYAIGGRGTDSEALRDHKAFLFSREKSLLVIPVSEWHELFGDGTGRPWVSYYSQGAYVFNLDLTNGFTLKGKISHTGNETTNDREATVRRSLFIDDVLYTLSNKKVKMNRLADLSEVNEVLLPQPTYETPVYTIEESVRVGAEPN